MDNKPKAKKMPFLKRLRFKYNLIILNERTLEEVFHIHISRLSIISIVGIFSIISFALITLLVFFTPIKHMIPGFEDSVTRDQVTSEMLRIDSITTKMEYSDRQLNSIKHIIAGTIPFDSTLTADSLANTKWDTTILKIGSAEKDFRNEYEKENTYNANSSSITPTKPTITLARPVRGTVTSSFAPNVDIYGISLLAQPNEPVLATLEGDIITTDFDANSGYSIIMQHKNGYISIYNNTGRLLRTKGDHVLAGEAIAFVGDPALENNNPQIVFELWLNGTAVNPEDYIVF